MRPSDLPERAGNSPSTSSPTKKGPLSILERLRRRLAWRLISLVLGGTALGLSLYYVAKKLLGSLQQLAQMELTVRVWPIAFSFAITLLCVFLSTIAWYLILKGFGASTRWEKCAPPHLVAAMGRYLPGYIWRHLGIAYLTRRQGVQTRQATLAVLWEFGQTLATRVTIAMITISDPWLASLLDWDRLPLLRWLRIAAWIALLTSPLFLKMFLRWRGKTDPKLPPDVVLRKGYLWLAMAAHLLGNLLYGIGFAVLLTALQPIDIHQFVAAIFSTAISWVLSLLIFFVPGGLGVRESAIIYTLGNLFPEPIAVMGALMSRVILILAELCGVLIGLWIWRRRSLCN